MIPPREWLWRLKRQLGLPEHVSLSDPARWTFEAQGSMQAYRTDGGLGFDLPLADAKHSHVRYFWARETGPVVGHVTGLLKLRYTPGTMINAIDNSSLTPPSVHLVLARSDWKDHWNLDAEFEHTRWWFREPVMMLDGLDSAFSERTRVFDVPLDPARWSNIYGRTAGDTPDAFAGFQKALAHSAMVGFSFSGGSSFGHGVNMQSGEASFVVTDLRIGR